MKIGCQSDHHLDHGYDHLQDAFVDSIRVPEVDVFIVAGDLAADHDLVRKGLLHFKKFVKHVIYVPGNHEHDEKDIHESRASLAKICASIPGVHLLDDGFVDIDGHRFIGSTLWSDCGNNEKQAKIEEFIFKYWPIMNGDRYFSPADSTAMHMKMLDYIAFQLSEARQRNLVPIVVTHQAPSKQSVHARFLASECNEAFYTDLDDFIELHEPAYWFHGHMHHSCKYSIGSTKVICNPLGAYNYENFFFNPDFVLEL